MAKTAIITGGSRGIGAACAAQLAKDGYAVVINYLANEAAARAVQKEIFEQGGEATIFGGDVRSPESMKALAAFAVGQYGRIDALVCSAGVCGFALAQDSTGDFAARLLDINTQGTINACAAAIPHMLSRGGAIITLASMWGEVGSSCESVYSASKGAVIAYTKALAKELGCSKITVNCVSPGFIDTEMNAGVSADARAQLVEETPLGRIGTPQDVAEAVAALVRLRFVTGQVLGVNGGLVI